VDHECKVPGSAGEHLLQQRHGTGERAARFYDQQMLDRLNVPMIEFVGRMEFMFVATSDSRGECDCTFRAGPPGFVQVLDERRVAWPEYRGNGVMASVGNIAENAHVGLLFIDFFRDVIGLHINGSATVADDAAMRAAYPDLPVDLVPGPAAPGVRSEATREDVASEVPAPVRAKASASGTAPGRRAERWVVVEIEEAYIHCAKHIPRLAKVPRVRAWGTDDVRRKGGDFFGASAAGRPWLPVPVGGWPNQPDPVTVNVPG
jgi:uncharacterized protein